MMQILFHPEAQAELNCAINHYEDSEPSLGHQFAIEVYAAVERNKSNPPLWPLLNDEVRRCLIQAIMHLHREPGYWSERA
jgi:toxin ParE1/3/4